MRILFIGDIFGNSGRRALAERLPSLIRENAVDVCIGNGENIAGGRGITGNLFKKLRKYGMNVVTGGNHSFSIPDNDYSFVDNSAILRPHNYPPGNIGKGYTIFELPDGRKVGIVNLQGRTFFHETLDCPFRTGKEVIQKLKGSTKVIFVDFHAEATSEKIAFAKYVDGHASAVIGTHTHVQTADERILPGGTAFLTDAGMTGPENSVIGMKSDAVIKHFLLQTHIRFEPSEEGAVINGVMIDVDESTGQAVSINRISQRVTLHHE